MDRRHFVGALVGTAVSGPGFAKRAVATAFTGHGLREEVARRALVAYEIARKRQQTTSDVYTIIDYTLPSHTKRLWTLDLTTSTVRHHLLVSHGSGSGYRVASTFSDTPGSYQSSLGMARAAERYHGKHGLSLRLDGLEPGINGRMRDRAIVIHGAAYATAAAVETNRRGEGKPRLGRSQGCPAVDPTRVGALIADIEGGGLVFGYHSQTDYWATTTYR